SPWPGGADLPRQYFRTLDPFVILTAAAAVTERLEVGTGIALVIQRDPIILAKEVASLDLISGGRAVLGVGAGWNREEMRNHGTDPKTRMRLLVERVEAVKALWTQDEAEYHGEFVDFDPVFCYPKPVQDPHPPVMIGGSGPTTFDRVLSIGDGWMPIYGRNTDALKQQIAELRERAGKHVPVVVFGVP
ncbi:LLM class F420-dependent oxidoreductase, partial [Actinomadura adrarensis]